MVLVGLQKYNDRNRKKKKKTTTTTTTNQPTTQSRDTIDPTQTQSHQGDGYTKVPREHGDCQAQVSESRNADALLDTEAANGCDSKTGREGEGAAAATTTTTNKQTTLEELEVIDG